MLKIRDGWKEGEVITLEMASRHMRAKHDTFDSGGRERAMKQTYESSTLCI